MSENTMYLITGTITTEDAINVFGNSVTHFNVIQSSVLGDVALKRAKEYWELSGYIVKVEEIDTPPVLKVQAG